MVIRRFTFFLLFLFFGCQNKSEPEPIVASTSWTAAYALAAGAEQVAILAPVSMLHPSEYEMKLSDLNLIRDSEYIVYAGYELMVKQMVQGLAEEKKKLLQIETGYRLHQIRNSVLFLAAQFGTLDQARRNLDQIETTFQQAKNQLSEYGCQSLPVLVHHHQVGFAEEIGLNVVGTFGPNPPEAYEIINLLEKKPRLIIDNYHNPVGESLEKSGGIKRVLWINFPGPNHTRTLDEVILSNIARLKP